LAPEDCTEDSEEGLDNDDSLAEEEDEEDEEEYEEEEQDWQGGDLYRALVSPSWARAAGTAAHPFRPPGFFAPSDLPASTRASSGRSASMAPWSSGGPVPVLGSPEMPTRGSAGHHLHNCKPCAFVDKGCESGVDCRFCHLCESGEKKRRKKEKLAMRRQIGKWRRSAKQQAATRSNNITWST
jgi:hypothetical protein